MISEDDNTTGSPPTEAGGSEEEEELPSLSNSPQDNNAGLEQEGTNSSDGEEELVSLPRSDIVNIEDNNSPSSELPSLSSNSPHAEENSSSSLLSVPVQDEPPQPSTSSASASAATVGRANNTTVHGFRSRIDENGETIFEFASDGESEDSEPEQQQPQQPVPAPLRRPTEDEERLEEEIIRRITLQRMRDSVNNTREEDDSDSSDDPDYLPTVSRRQAQVEDEGDEEDEPEEVSSDDDSDYTPSSGTRLDASSNTAAAAILPSVAQRVTGRRSGASPGHVLGSSSSPGVVGVLTHLGTIRQLQVEPSAAVAGARQVGRKRRKARAPKKKKKKPGVARVQKPLVPKIIIQKENGNETAELYHSQVVGLALHRSNINFTTTLVNNNTNQEIEDESHCKVGKVLLRIENATDLHALKEAVNLSKFPGLKNMILHVSDHRDFGLIQLTTEETLSDEEGSRRPVPPRLSSKDRQRKLIFVVRKTYLFTCHVEGFPMKMFNSTGFGNKKVFRLDFVGFIGNNEEDEHGKIQLDILIDKSFIFGSHDLRDIPYNQNKMLVDTFNFMFKVQLPAELENDATGEKEEDIPWFYGQIKKYHGKEVLPSPTFSLQPEIVGPTLRPYQRDAVKWMLYREGVMDPSADEQQSLTPRVNLRDSFFEKMYVPVLIGDKAAFYNPYIGYLSWTVPTVAELPSGGILADEMGLGKTVEVICLVLLNPRPMEQYEDGDGIAGKLSDDDDEKNSASSGQDSDMKSIKTNSCSDDEESSSDGDSTRRKKRGRPKNKKAKGNPKSQQQKRKRPRKKARTIDDSDSEEEEDDVEPVKPMRPNLKRSRKRNISPCTFLTDGPETTGDDNGSIINNSSLNHAPASSSTAGSSNNNKRSRKDSSLDSKTGISKQLLKTSEPTTTYEKLKAIYDAQLLSYNESRHASRPRFNGTFFDTKIARIARFECICGGSNDDNRNKIVTCSSCSSSQHADCVGFSKEIQRRFITKSINYLCPHCTTLEKPYPAKSTLIITPDSISHQWINELKRHVKKQNMSILFYKGVNNQDYIPPVKLAEFDIVITTYTTLTSELNYTELPHMNSEDGRRFRNSKRFMTIPSPLPCVGWWRVCLDEAQMVEGISTKMSIMAMKLQAEHRWCITGTPINEGLQDLFGLFAFLGVEPVALDFWWQKLVQDPFHRKDVSLLFELFGQLIWRMSKNDVLDQLGIPPQTSLVRWLTFSAVEEHFYKQQYEICSRKILDKISRLRQTNSNILESRLSALDRQILQSLLLPFLELRKACCHPQMVKGQSVSLQKGTMTMEELLAQLIKKTSIQCADDHRQIVASLNGMAGIHMIKEEWFVASERYREVLQSAEKNKGHFHTDSLQLLHTLENLADLLDRNHDGVPYTLRDGSLRSEAEVLKQKYLEKYATSVKSARALVEPLTKLAKELSAKFKCNSNSSWWVTTLSKAAKMGKIDDFVNRIKDELVTGPDAKEMKHVISMATKIHDAYSLEHVLVENILEIEKLREKALEGLEKLQQQDPSSFVHAAVSCHLRKKSQLYYKESDELGFRCQLCQHHDQFMRYESYLFKETKKVKIVRTGRKWQQQKLMGELATDLTNEEMNLVLLKEEEELIESLEHINVGMSNELRHGTWADSDTEKVLKLIKNFARINRLAQDVQHDASTHIKLFEAMKKEFRVLRILWKQIYHQISAHDELSQATTRLCLSYNNKNATNSGEGSSTTTTTNNNDDEPQPGPSTGAGSRRKQKKPKQLQDAQIEQDQRIQNINVLERHEIEPKMVQMRVELETGKESLGVHMGQLLYLESLKKKDYGKKGQINTEECPVCQCQLGQEWVVLVCGHSYCASCVKTMCPNVLQSFLCPLCRQSVKYADVSFVDTKEIETNSPSKKKTKSIKGSHSTKVEAIVELALELQESHPGEKVIVFSTWVDVLDIIAKALKQNDITNCLLTQSGKKFQTELERFKQREDVQVLLMPLASGAKGLNIIEATHILLVEPILSQASEMQAIGRIHRIGQTKDTFVHRFYVKNTIEEQLLEVLKTSDVSSDAEGSLTVADLQNLIRNGKDYAGSNIVTLD